MFLFAAVGQNTGVDARVQGLHAALQALGEVGNLGDFGDGHTGGGDRGCGRTGRHQLHARLVQTAGELRQISFVVHGNEGAAQGQTIELLHRH